MSAVRVPMRSAEATIAGSPAGTGVQLAPPARDMCVPDSFWTSLAYFNVYRLVLAGFFCALALLQPQAFSLAEYSASVFAATALIYLLVAVGFQWALRRLRLQFALQLRIQVLTDIVIIATLMYASGGFKSGLGVLMLISLAGAALVTDRLNTLLFAALASIAILLEQAVWVLYHKAPVSAFLQPGLLATGFFVTALITNRLAYGLIHNETVARERGIELANQLRINQLVIQDVHDGVMVVDSNGLVRQHNRQVESLLGKVGLGATPLERYSAQLASAVGAWRAKQSAHCGNREILRFVEAGRRIQARFIEVGVDGASFSLIFLEDLSRLEEEAQKLKLVALGRLTASIAHEIRNPLSAITHACDLVREENRAQGRERLIRIIRDNAYRLDRMVKDILELNRRDSVQAERFDLGGYLQTFVEEFAQTEQIPLEGLAIQSAQSAHTIECDRVHLNQILWNLARNAWRHSRQRQASVQFRMERSPLGLELHVIDDGAGVPAELRTQLFEPFFTTYSKGTGLGLYIARELAAANGAVLDYVARSEGADFRIHWQGART